MTNPIKTIQHDPLTHQVIGSAIEVHRALGPGLLESAYEECFCWELKHNGFTVQRQVPLPVIYKQVRLNVGYRIDLIVNQELIIELKTVDKLMPIHEAQLLTYMRLSKISKGLLMNFHLPVLRDGIKRMVL